MIGPLRASISDNAAELLRMHEVHERRCGNLPSSIDHRDQKLRCFARWLAPTELLDATRQDIETFLDKRKTRDGRAINSRTRYYWIANLHGFYKWALNEELTDRNPTVAIIRPRQRRTLPRPIGNEDLETAIRVARPEMRAMLSLAALAGLRVAEIAGLERDDVLEAKMLLRVRHGKGDKERIVPLHPDLLEALRMLPMPRTGRLFTRPRGDPYQGNTMSHAIGTYLKDVGIDATAHQLRHFFATEVYAFGHDKRVTQELLGHSDPATTAGYVAYSHIDAAAAVASLSLRSGVTTELILAAVS